MSDYYALSSPCPKCQSNCWQKVGGYKGLPIDYSCLICGWMLSRTIAAEQAAEREIHAND